MKPVAPHSLMYRATLTLLFCVLLVTSLYYAKGVLIPIITAALLAMLLLPMVRRFERMKMGRFFSVICSLLLVLAVFATVVFVLSAQVISFSSDIPVIEADVNQKFLQMQQWVEAQTGLTSEQQLLYLQKTAASMLDVAQSVAATIVAVTTGTIVFVGLLLVLIFFFLYYRGRIRNFLLQAVPADEHINTARIIKEVSHVTQKYLLGVFIVMGILSILNSILFLLIGVPHAIFFGILASILNVVPYIGVWVGTLLPILMMAISQDSIAPILLILVGVWVTQQIDNNILTPKITGSRVSINPLATIIILIVGGFIWGVAGMVLFIPLLGIAKIICDNVDGLKPFGYLIGDDTGSSETFFVRWIRSWKGKQK